jgi:hypothetical protein
MNRVERANLERSQDTRCIQDAIVHANQIQLSSLIPWKLEIGSWELISAALRSRVAVSWTPISRRLAPSLRFMRISLADLLMRPADR